MIVFPDGFFDQPVGVFNGTSVDIPFSIYVQPDTKTPLTLSASSADGLTFSFNPSTLPPPGYGDTVLTVTAQPDAFPIDRQVTVNASYNDTNGNPLSATATFPVKLYCDPAAILGTDQPASTPTALGSQATLTVKPTGTGPFTFQWYMGHRGSTLFPLSGNSPTLTTPPINRRSEFWVRITNPCGSVDSDTATVSVIGQPNDDHRHSGH